jgi:dynein heavy chain
MPREVITTAGVHVCPVYKVKSRAESWVFDVALKTKSPPQKWVIGGVALVLEK